MLYIEGMEANYAQQHNIDSMALGPELTEAQAEQIFALGKDAVVFVLLRLAKMAAEQNQNKLPVGSHDDPS